MELFESYDRRIDKILGVLKEYGIGSVEECRDICAAAGLDPYKIVKDVQPIAFENAGWAYTVGAAIAIKTNARTAVEAAKAMGIGLQSFCIPGSVAEDRKVGRGHGNLAAMLLQDETQCFCFLAGHESFAAAEGAIGIVRNANKARKVPLRVILNGLGKDAAQIISRINGFTYVQTQFDYFTGKLNIVREIRYSETERADVRCYGADDVREGVAIMHHEGVDVSITGNSTNPTRFQHPVAGTYKKECIEQGKKYFSVASGGGTGRGGRSRIFGAVIQTETTVFGDRGKPALALARPLPHQTFARHQKTRVNHLPDRDAPRTMRRPWRSLRQLIDILLGQITGVLVIPDAPVFHDESDRLFLPRFQQGRCAVSEILQLIGQRETT